MEYILLISYIMKTSLVVVVIYVMLLLNAAIIINGEGDYEITDCDRDIAKILCADFKTDVASCAELMPKDEQKFFYECAADLKISSEENWIGLLSDVCSETDPAQIAADVIFCWNDKMNATVDEMGDDKVYPYEHFKCKERLYTEALEKTSCLCQLEKGSSCVKIPSGPWSKSIPKFG